MSTTPRAFVLMPFDAEFKSIYDDLIKPALEDAGYEVTRADSPLDQQNILRDIIQGIANADLIVADLTTVNANVFYELGLCHGLRIPTVLLTQSIEDVPFDLRPYKIQIYELRFDRIHKLKEALKDIGEKHKKREITFGSPIIDFFPTGRSTLPVKVEDEVAGALAEDQPEDDEEQGVLDYAAEVEAAFGEMSRVITEITKENEKITNKVTGHSARLQALNASSSAGTAGQKQKVVMLVASDMNLCAKRFEEEAPLFEKAVGTLMDGFTGLMKFANRTEEETKQMINFRQMLPTFLENTKVATEAFRTQRDVTAGLKGISKDVNRASRRLAQALDSIIQNMEKVEAFAVRVMALIDQWLEEGAATQKLSYSALFGSGKGSFASPSEADRFVRAERETWDE